MATSITTCGRPGVVITGTGKVSFSYKTKSDATTATTELELVEAARNSARRDAKLQCSCDNAECRNRHASLESFTMTTSVERGFFGWLISLFGGRGWRAVANFDFTVEVWCAGSPDAVRPSEPTE